MAATTTSPPKWPPCVSIQVCVVEYSALTTGGIDSEFRYRLRLFYIGHNTNPFLAKQTNPQDPAFHPSHDLPKYVYNQMGSKYN